MFCQGCVHCWCGPAQASGHLQVLAQVHQPQEADRGEVQPLVPEHDHAETSQTVQTARDNQDSGHQGLQDHGRGGSHGFAQQLSGKI